MGAIIAELEPGKLYEYEGQDRTAAELAKELLLVVAAQEVSGGDAAPIRFSRSHSTSTEPEFVIAKRDDATLYIVTEDSVVEAGVTEERRSGVEDRRSGNARRSDSPSQQERAQDLVGV